MTKQAETEIDLQMLTDDLFGRRLAEVHSEIREMIEIMLEAPLEPAWKADVVRAFNAFTEAATELDTLARSTAKTLDDAASEVAQTA